MHQSFTSTEVAETFANYPESVRPKLLALRELIFSVAQQHDDIGELEETLKWSEPSYIPSKTKSGTTVRIDWKEKTPGQYFLFVNCKTTLVNTYKELFDDVLTFGGNRSIIFDLNKALPEEAVRECIALALLYYKR